MDRRPIFKPLIAIATAIALTGCAGLSERDQRIGSGAALGGLAGGALTGGSAGGIIGGAAIGGIGGAVVDNNKRQRELEERQRYDEQRRYDERRRWEDQRWRERRDGRGYHGRPY